MPFLLKDDGDRLLLENGGRIVLTDSALASTVVVGTGTIETRFIRTEFPITEGLIAGTTRQTGRPNLEVS